VGLCPTSIAITPDGKQAYISNYSDDTLSVIDTQTHAVTSIVLGMVNNAAGILVHDGPQDLAVNPKGGFVYLASRSGLLHKINTATNTVVVAQDLILVGGINYCTADRLALTPDGSKVFVTGGSCGSFEVLDGNLNYLYSPPQNTLCGPGGIKVAPDGGRAYLVDNECGSLYEIDTNNYSLRQSTPIPQGFPTDAMITTDSKQAYVGYQPYSSATLPGLWDIDTATLTVPATLSVPLGGTSAGMAFAPANNTPVGAPITVQPLDRVTGTSPVTVTFSQVTQAGFTGLLTSSTGFAPPAGFQLGSPAVYYDLTTTAQYPPNLAGSITVCINFTGISFPGPPALFHYESGAWVNQTTSVNNTTNTVCGTVSSLSPFTLFAQSASQTPLIITANNASRMYGQPDPALNNVIYSGFVNGDGPGWLSGTLTCTTGDTTSSPVGIYAKLRHHLCSGNIDHHSGAADRYREQLYPSLRSEQSDVDWGICRTPER
jgi:YVTN family beta-propeller protein